MGTIYLIIFLLAEIALIVLTFTKFGQKTSWLKNRTITSLTEGVILLAIILLPTTYLKWRFLAAMLVLVIRIAIAGIVWLASSKKAEGNKNKALAVIASVLSVAFVAVSLAPAFVFSNYNGLKNTGSMNVKETNAILVDKSRPDTFENDGSFREVPVHFYYPENAAEKYPLIVFSHGAFGFYLSNYSTYTELASNGYIVAALDHPHHAFYSEDTQGNTVIVDSNFINTAMTIGNTDDFETEEVYAITREWMKLRTDDENFVIDSIEKAIDSNTLDDSWYTSDKETILSVLSVTDTDKIGLLGHSMGGATSVNVGRQRSDIDAVLVLDGTMLGEYTGIENGKYIYESEPYPVPILDFTKEKDYIDRDKYKKENGYPYVNEYVIDNAVDGRTAVFSGAEHMDFTDLPLISPMLASVFGRGDVNNEEFMTMINGIVLDWFNYYLKNEGTLDIQAKY